jgi:hypothetical protein
MGRSLLHVPFAAAHKKCPDTFVPRHVWFELSVALTQRIVDPKDLSRLVLDLTLGELLGSTGTAKTGLLTFLHATIAGQHSGISQAFFQLGIVGLQSPCDSQLAGVCLASVAATADANDYVDRFTTARAVQRSQHRILVLSDGEILLHRAFVNGDCSLAGTDTHSGDRAFASAGSQDVVCAFAFGFSCLGHLW